MYDGKWDCPNGDDKVKVMQDTTFCYNMYKCKHTSVICIHLGNLCVTSSCTAHMVMMNDFAILTLTLTLNMAVVYCMQLNVLVTLTNTFLSEIHTFMFQFIFIL